MTSRVVLLGGFGGLLLLMGYAGLDGIQALEQIRGSNDSVREDFWRARGCWNAFAAMFTSRHHARLPARAESGKAEGHRYSLLETRNDTDAALGAYRKLMNRREAKPLEA
jgi:hypothetical protein